MSAVAMVNGALNIADGEAWPTALSKYLTDIDDSNLLGLADAADPAAASAASGRSRA
jgi:hypothetical protein